MTIKCTYSKAPDERRKDGQGAMLPRTLAPQRVPGEAIWRLWNTRQLFSGRAPLRDRWGRLQRSPRPSSWLPLPKNPISALGALGPRLRPSPLTRNRRLGPCQHDGLDAPMCSDISSASHSLFGRQFDVCLQRALNDNMAVGSSNPYHKTRVRRVMRDYWTAGILARGKRQSDLN